MKNRILYFLIAVLISPMVNAQEEEGAMLRFSSEEEGEERVITAETEMERLDMYRDEFDILNEHLTQEQKQLQTQMRSDRDMIRNMERQGAGIRHGDFQYDSPDKLNQIMAIRYNLTPEQQERVRFLNQRRVELINQMPEENRREMMEAMNREYENEMKQVLDDDQFRNFEENRKILYSGYNQPAQPVAAPARTRAERERQAQQAEQQKPAPGQMFTQPATPAQPGQPQLRETPQQPNAPGRLNQPNRAQPAQPATPAQPGQPARPEGAQQQDSMEREHGATPHLQGKPGNIPPQGQGDGVPEQFVQPSQGVQFVPGQHDTLILGPDQDPPREDEEK